MAKKSVSTREHVIREYPDTTYWLEGNVVQGVGNLILTSHRLIFLNRVVVEDWQLEKMQQLSGEEDLNQLVDFSLKLHKKNFQIQLPGVTNVKQGLYSWLPVPRLCVRIHHRTRKGNTAETGFWFRIPLLKGLFQIEFILVTGWINAIKKAAGIR